MSVTVIHPPIQPALEKALGATLNDIAEDMNQYCKWLSGDTSDSMTSAMRGTHIGEVSWNTPYAAYAYYRGTPSKAGRQLRWAEYAARLHGKQWCEDIGKRAELLCKQ